MSEILPRWVQAALDHADMKQADLSRALIQAGLRTVDRSAVNKILLGTRKLSGDEMLEVSRITGYPLPESESPFAKGPASAAAPQTTTVVAVFERSLVAKVFEILGMERSKAEDFVTGIAKVARLHQEQKDDISEDQILREARVLVAVFDPLGAQLHAV